MSQLGCEPGLRWFLKSSIKQTERLLLNKLPFGGRTTPLGFFPDLGTGNVLRTCEEENSLAKIAAAAKALSGRTSTRKHRSLALVQVGAGRK